MVVQWIITTEVFVDNIIPLNLFNQCLFSGFPINTTLLITVYSFTDKVRYDVF
jgi:hypothetical protein